MKQALRQPGTRATPTAVGRRAFTLLEVLLVLGIMLAAAAIILPNLSYPMQGHRLRKSADLVRAEWARARVKAMKTGQVHMFRCEPNGTGFQIEPYYTEQDALEFTPLDPTGQAAPAGPMPNSTPPVTRRVNEDVYFADVRVAGDTRAQDLQSQTSLTGQATQATGELGQLSPPILFYPDGSTSTAQVVLGLKRNVFLIVELRGLNGTSQASDLLSQQQVAELTSW